ncbi:MAG TPA: glycosyltransferase family 2 protein [Flavipsychrobacter sp.]|jgi:glycosyltransferase involved in cell wall biosynthesis|nr:glycosyltransferase family 2 protein [Flavipsychrobacter sp.]
MNLSSDPEITVVVPVYNVESYIATCIHSLLAQSFRDFELLLIDDCGSDQSIKIAEQILSEQQRIPWRVVRLPTNSGLGDARNVGIETAKGTFIAFVDSDDWVPYTMLEDFHDEIVLHPDSIVCGNTVAVTEGEQSPYWVNVTERKVFEKTDAIKRMLTYNEVLDTAWAKIIPKKLFIDNNIRFPSALYFEDTPTNLRLFDKAENVIAIPNTVYFYRQNRPGSILQQKSVKSVHDRLFVFEDIFSYLCTIPSMDYEFSVDYYLHRLAGEYRNIFKNYHLPHRDQQSLAKEVAEKVWQLKRKNRHTKVRRYVGIKFDMLLKKGLYKNTLLFYLLHNNSYSVFKSLIDFYM